jgi:hypothetical protein
MAAGIKALRKIQIGKEATAGTAVSATAIWRGEGTLKDDRSIEFVPEDVGLLEPTDRSYVPKLGGIVTLDETPATFEQVGYLLMASISGVTTATTDTGGSGKVWTFNVATTQPNNLKTFTVEGGDNQRFDDVEYAYVTEFQLSGAKGEAVMMSATLRGRQATDSEPTGSLSIPTVEEILFGKGKLYIDSTTMGTTQKTETWLGFSLTVPSGWKEVYTGDGNLYFTKLEYVGHRDNPITGEITLEHDATAEAEINAARNETLRLLRMTFQGTALQTSGTFTYKTLQISLPVKYTEVPEMDDEDGDDVVTLPFRAVYDVAGARAASIVVVNELANLP